MLTGLCLGDTVTSCGADYKVGSPAGDLHPSSFSRDPTPTSPSSSSSSFYSFSTPFLLVLLIHHLITQVELPNPLIVSLVLILALNNNLLFLVLACEIWCMMIMSVVSFSLSYNETWYWMCIDANYLLVSFMIPDLYLWEVLADSHQEDRHKIGQP